MIFNNKLKPKKIIITKILCGLIIAGICFGGGNMFQKHHIMQKDAEKLSTELNTLRNELYMMSTLMSDTDYNLSDHDKSDWFYIELCAARVYDKLLSLKSLTDEDVFYVGDLKYSRPSVDFLLELSKSIMLMEWKDYPEVFEKAKPLMECNAQTNLWDWLDGLDSKLLQNSTDIN